MEININRKSSYQLLLIFLILLFVLNACSSGMKTQQDGLAQEKIRVVATTTILADVVSQVGGDHIELETLLPVGADPHGFDPTPQDIARVADADLVFAVGGGLEAFLEDLIESAGAENKIIFVSDGIDFIDASDAHDEHEEENEDVDEHHDESEEQDIDRDHYHGDADPHTWTDPNNVVIWIENIQNALSDADQGSAQAYSENAEAYIAVLGQLDSWIREQVSMIPEENRVIVTDHKLFTYFNARYGFTQVGAIIPGYSSLAEPTAKELAELEDAIMALDVPAVFVGNTVNPALAERVTEDTGKQLVYIYTGSLSDADGPASTYEAYVRYNVKAIIEALQ